jgi:hypothetical protein
MAGRADRIRHIVDKEVTVSIVQDLSAVVLHSLRLKGRAGVPPIASAVRADPGETLTALQRHAADGLAVFREGRIGGWMLTPAGREHWEHWLRAERAGIAVDGLGTLYDEEFLDLNRRFKMLCTEWQVAARGDRAEFLARLAHVHTANIDLVERFGRCAGRLAGAYPPRFTAAFDRFGAGDDAALLQPFTDSYHDVWLELHEDLLLLLDREREPED